MSFVNQRTEGGPMFGERLKLARKKAGHSLRSLAGELKGAVSAQAIGKYERGEMMPTSGVLTALAKTLDVSLDYLLSQRVERLEGVEFRKKSRTSAKDRARVEATVIEQVERYLAIEEILELDSAEWNRFSIGQRKLGQIEDAERLAIDVRKAWKLGLDPIPNMTELLEERGIKVLVCRLPEGVYGLTCMVKRETNGAAVPVIVIDNSTTLERRRLTLAHELGHRFIGAESCIDHENASYHFAGSFLIPNEHLKREIGKHRNSIGYHELIQLKRMYRVSAAALLVRLKSIGIIDESTLSYAFRSFAKGWRVEEPEPLEPRGKEGKQELPKRFERLCYWALAEKFVSAGKAAELLQQPLESIEQGMKGPIGNDASNRKRHIVHH
jgi:Zn-dependent peptidase ImmA (M78 family)/DNA-binding XRE family transcriptional regulator